MKYSFICLILASFLWAAPGLAQTTSTALNAATAPAPLILKMADGRYYNPSSGLFGNTRNELLAVLGFPVGSTETEVTPPPIALNAIPPILEAVTQARAMLAVRLENEQASPTKPLILPTDADWRPITLAIWNKTTGQIATCDGFKKGLKLKQLTPATAPCSLLKVIKSQGIDSEYSVDRQGENVVVATKYQTLSEIKQKSKIAYQAKDVIYTPYAKDLKVNEVVAQGQAQLTSHLQAALAELRANGLRSRAFPDRLLADVSDPSLIETVAVIEHVDHNQAVRDPGFALDTLHVIVAANGDDAFAFNRSSAGALGLPQFMPATYARLAASAQFGLIKDFNQAMRDQQNAFKAEAIYLDSLLADLTPEVREAYLNQATSSREMVAAAYNAGPARVRKSADAWLAASDPRTLKKTAALQQEHDRVWVELLAAKDKALNSSDQATRDKWQAKRLALRVQHASLESKLQKQPQLALKQETLDYLTKFRAFYPVVAQRQITAQLALSQ